jgi:hypothetical protein
LVIAASTGIVLRANRAPHLPFDVADGRYVSDCCGSVELRDGEMIANGRRWVSYVVMEDERGPYILPDTYVGTSDDGIELDGSRPVRRLRLDALPGLNSMEMPRAGGTIRLRRLPPLNR